MKKSILTLLALLVCVIQPITAYEYFTIYFSDGTKSEVFYATDVDSICYSKFSLESIAYDDWQVQEIYTCDSVYRYPLAQIDSLSFKDVDINKVAKNYAQICSFINSEYLKCKSSTELAQQISTINMDGVEDMWTDSQSLSIKLKDWGVISYSFFPHKDLNNVRNNGLSAPNKNMVRRTHNNSETVTHKHVKVKNVCVITQMAKDKDFEDAIATSDSIVKMCREWGLDVTINNDLRPDFFINGIRQYDIVFLMTHGMYDGCHWLSTNEEIYSQTLESPVNEDSLFKVAKEFIETKYLKKGYSPKDICFSKNTTENRNGKKTLVCYTCISSSFISKHKNPKSNNIVVFNAACQSMKGNNPELADAFINMGTCCYTGFTESNSIGPWTNEFLCEMLLNGCSIYSAYNILPDYLYTETLELPENSGSYVYPKLILWPEEKNVTSICITHPETLPAEFSSENGESIIKLKGMFKCLYPDTHVEGATSGILISKSEESVNEEPLDNIILKSDKDKNLLNIEATLFESKLEPNTTYYYRAYMNDGCSDCYGEIKSFATKGNAEAYYVWDETSKTSTYYYDGMRENRNGIKIYDRNEVGTGSVKVVFDSSFSGYYPKGFRFTYCRKLQGIENLNYLNTDSITDMEFMFYECSALTSLDLSHFNTSNATKMNSMFNGCNSLTRLDLRSFNTSNVTSMVVMFHSCSSLTNLDLSSFNTSNVTNMNGMFWDCNSLTNLYLSSFNTSNVTNMGTMFCGCNSLTNLDLSSFNTSNVTSMGLMFSDCRSLTNLDLSNFNTSNVTSMKEMFSDCRSLTNLDLSNFNTSNVTNMEYMFNNCNSLTSLDLSHFDTSNVTIMGYMFKGCTNLQSLNVDNFNISNIGNTSTITSGVQCMFSGCSSLKVLDLSSFYFARRSTIDHMFDNCRSLTTIYASCDWDVYHLDFHGPFYGCENLVGGKGSRIGGEWIGNEIGDGAYFARIDGGEDKPGFFTAK